MLKKFISRLVFYIKGRELELDERIKNRDLMFFLIAKLTELIRGFIKFRKICFVGKSTQVEATDFIYLGRGINIGKFCQISAISKCGLEIDDFCSIGNFCIIRVSGSWVKLGEFIKIGRNVGIGDFAHIGGAGGVSIGNDTIIGSYFSIHPENHNFNDLETPIRSQGVNHQGIIIGSNCWIGAKVTVLDGSKIGDGCVIAAGAIVKGEFPDNAIIGGVPAKILKYR